MLFKRNVMRKEKPWPGQIPYFLFPVFGIWDHELLLVVLALFFCYPGTFVVYTFNI